MCTYTRTHSLTLLKDGRTHGWYIEGDGLLTGTVHVRKQDGSCCKHVLDGCTNSEDNHVQLQRGC